MYGGADVACVGLLFFIRVASTVGSLEIIFLCVIL